MTKATLKYTAGNYGLPHPLIQIPIRLLSSSCERANHLLLFRLRCNFPIQGGARDSRVARSHDAGGCKRTQSAVGGAWMRMNERMVWRAPPGAGTLESGSGLAPSLLRQMVLGLFWRLCLCCFLLPSPERVPHHNSPGMSMRVASYRASGK